MKLIATSLALFAASTLAAHADSFTFTGTAQITSEVGGPVAGGKPVGAAFSSGGTSVKYASGKTSTSKSQCASWSATAGSAFTSQGICMADEGASQFSVAFSCQAMDAAGAVSDCWGRLTGMTGTYANKTGMASWRGIRSADKKSIVSTGTGSWN